MRGGCVSPNGWRRTTNAIEVTADDWRDVTLAQLGPGRVHVRETSEHVASSMLPRGDVGVPELLIITGPPGAGKSTVSELVAARFDRCALVRGDTFFGFVARGYIDPWLPGVPRAERGGDARHRDGGGALRDGWLHDHLRRHARPLVPPDLPRVQRTRVRPLRGPVARPRDVLGTRPRSRGPRFPRRVGHTTDARVVLDVEDRCSARRRRTWRCGCRREGSPAALRRSNPLLSEGVPARWRGPT